MLEISNTVTTTGSGINWLPFIIAFFVVDTIVMFGVVFFVITKRNQSGGSTNTPNTFNNPTDSPFSSSSGSATGDDDVLDALRRGQKIEAIKIYRERTNCGLKEAKDAVEAMERQAR